MVHYCYLDDSKYQNQTRLVVSAGFFGTQDQWGGLRTQWKRQIEQDGLSYFKTSEWKSLSGEFARFKTADYPPPTGRDAANAIRERLHQVVKRFPRILGIGISIPVVDYERVYSRPQADEVFNENPYVAALQGVFRKMVEIMQRLPGRNMVAFVHDEGLDFPLLHDVYRELRKLNPVYAKYMGDFQPLDDKRHPPLQMADMVANLALGVGLEWLDTRRAPEKLKAMEENMFYLGTWDEHFMLSVLKRNFQRLGVALSDELKADEYG